MPIDKYNEKQMEKQLSIEKEKEKSNLIERNMLMKRPPINLNENQ